MDFTTLQTEVFDRGHNDLNDGGTGTVRAKRWINESIHEINAVAAWPYLRTSTSGPAPLTVSTVRRVLAVTNNTADENLAYVDKALLERVFPDTPDTGTPSLWYFNTPTQIAVYPADTASTFEVLYVKVGADLVAGADVPDMPTRYQGLIVDLAAYRAYLQKDNPEIAQNLRAHVDRMLGQMRADLLVPSSEPLSIIQTDW